MNNLWYSFRELKNSIIFKVLIVIQITIAGVLLYRVNEIRSYENNKLNAMEKITENKRIYQFVSEYDSIDAFLNDQQEPNKFNNFSKSVQEEFTLFTATYGEIALKNFDGIENFKDLDFKNMNIDGPYTLVKSIQASPNFFDIFNIKLSSGTFEEFNKFTMLNYSEWSEEYIPIILGDSYKNIFSLNEIIETKEYSCKVIGFIEQNQFFLDKGIYDLTRVKNLNTFVISPIPKNIMNANINSAFIIVDNSSSDNFNFIKSKIDSLAKNQNIKLTISDPNENINEFIEILQYNSNIKLIIMYFILLFTVIGLIVIFTNRVSVKRKEYSIHIIHGATIKDICIRIIMEHAFLAIFSMIISFVYLFKNNISIITDIITFNQKIFFESALIIITIILLVSLIPIYYVKKYRLNYLIKGE